MLAVKLEQCCAAAVPSTGVQGSAAVCLCPPLVLGSLGTWRQGAAPAVQRRMRSCRAQQQGCGWLCLWFAPQWTNNGPRCVRGFRKVFILGIKCYVQGSDCAYWLALWQWIAVVSEQPSLGVLKVTRRLFGEIYKDCFNCTYSKVQMQFPKAALLVEAVFVEHK